MSRTDAADRDDRADRADGTGATGRAARVRDLMDRIGGPVAVVGSANADLTVRVRALPGPGETVTGGPLEVLPGGKSANQSAAGARLGADVAFIGCVGRDANAGVLRDALTDAGVDLSGMEEADVATGTAMITVDDDAENCIVISAGANGEVTPELVRRHRGAIESARALGLCLEISLDAVTEAARIAHDAGARVVFNLSPVGDAPAELLGLVDVLIVNEHELAHLVGTAAVDAGREGDWTAASAELAGRYGIPHAVVTLGGAGSTVIGAEGAHAVAAWDADVVDTTGCGDAYMGTLLAGLASGLTLTESAELASAVSAYAATGAGAQASYGTAGDIVAWAAAAGAGG
ncbi:ribokinase [Corynebacterium sp.]|uniref:ribokinase n=1 Tax=Corynebacterium sp. TaxID=1720 RepID=UPI0026DC8D52|nr:ribokinase [Corynebacterium sp.]MDO4610523.1 ribokinase [Corynebacterium sp.]